MYSLYYVFQHFMLNYIFVQNKENLYFFNATIFMRIKTKQ